MWFSNKHGFAIVGHQMASPTITVRVVINTGSMNEPDQKTYGISHFIEHMLFKGTNSMSYTDINKTISSLGVGNAYTCADKTAYYINCLPENLENALAFLSQIVFESIIPEEEMEKERNVILEEYQSGLEDPMSYFYSNAIETIFGENFHSVIGTKESISGITKQNMIDYMKKQYVKRNMMFVIAGNIKKEKVEKICEKVLSKYENVTEGVLESFPMTPRLNVQCQLDHISTQTIMGLCFNCTSPDDWDKTNYVCDLFNCGLGGYTFNYNMLFDNVREKFGLCYSIGAKMCLIKGANSTIISALMDSNNYQKVKDECLNTLNNIAQDGFSDELMKLAKNNLMYCMIAESTIPADFAYTFMDDLFFMPVIDLEQKQKSIMKLTNNDIKQYAASLLNDGYSEIRMN